MTLPFACGAATRTRSHHQNAQTQGKDTSRPIRPAASDGAVATVSTSS